MLGTEPFRDLTGIRSLVALVVAKSNGESLHRLRTESCHQRYDRRGIRTTTQKSSEGHISRQPDAHGFSQSLFELGEAFFF